MELLIAAFVLLYIMSLVWHILTDNKRNKLFSAFALIILSIILMALISSYENRNVPTAMDVYKGKTTLKTDSVVVFKEEFKK